MGEEIGVLGTDKNRTGNGLSILQMVQHTKQVVYDAKS